MICRQQANKEEEGFCVHNQCFSDTNLPLRGPRSQGSKYGKNKKGRTTGEPEFADR
jgi:hypothetical protein